MVQNGSNNTVREVPLLGRLRTRHPELQHFAGMSSTERELAKHSEIVGNLRAIVATVQDLQFAIVRKEQHELPFRIEEKGECDVHDGTLDIQPQTSGLQEIRTILITCQSVLPLHMRLLLDNTHTLFLSGVTVLTTQVLSLTQQELLVHSTTRRLTWTAGTAGNKLNVTITGVALPQLKGRRELQ